MLKCKAFFVMVVAAMPLLVAQAAAQEFMAHQAPPVPLFAVKPLLATADADEVYPSVAGDYLVYSRRLKHEFSVARVGKRTPAMAAHVVAPTLPKEAIRFGVALTGGEIGYVSNRMGPIGAWMHQAIGDGHVAIGNMGTFTGALMPMNLRASPDGRMWCFDTSLEKTRRAKMLDDFDDGFMHSELIGQSWRIYSSDAYRYKQGYAATQSGAKNTFEPPALFVFDRKSSQLTMIPNAFDGAISPDGRRIVFAREINGNYDLWLQDVDGSALVQLTSSDYGEFEPAWSPDGTKIAFISNRDSKGSVRHTSIYVMDLQNGRTWRLTNAPRATDGGPTWKDDHTILFHSNRDPAKPQAATVDDWNIWQVEFQGGF